MSASVLSRIGLGLWTMRSLALGPRNRVADYREFAEDAVTIEELGFDSIWSAEHRIWYDGWCPAPLHALALAAGRTERVRLGTAVALAPQHDPVGFARTAATLDRIAGGRLALGIGLGHRDVEFDTFGLRRDRRGRRMDEALAQLAATWEGARRPSQLWIGGLASQAFERAGRGGHNVMLPQTLRGEQIVRAIDTLRSHDGWDGTVGALRDVWIETDAAAARSMRARFDRTFREEAGWWVLKGRPAFEVPDDLERQMERINGAALIGTADEVAEGLRALFAHGVEFLCLRINLDIADHPRLREQIHRVASELPERLAGAL
jgi:alkanesulfonate monooxygenase SsuD/methylene tetrahydromethanopterin reductase-like flavin-dependent oxidoreductase (luciferase family)